MPKKTKKPAPASKVPESKIAWWSSPYVVTVYGTGKALIVLCEPTKGMPRGEVVAFDSPDDDGKTHLACGPAHHGDFLMQTEADSEAGAIASAADMIARDPMPRHGDLEMQVQMATQLRDFFADELARLKTSKATRSKRAAPKK